MSLNRVPPNLLVGAGATDFAYERGVPILPADFLMSHGARQRWTRWKRELDYVEGINAARDEAMGQEGLNTMHDSSSDGFCSPSMRGMSPDGSPAPDVDDISPDERQRSVGHHSGFGFHDAEMESNSSSAFRPVNDSFAEASKRGSANRKRDEDITDSGYVDDTFSQMLRPGVVNTSPGHSIAAVLEQSAVRIPPVGPILRHPRGESPDDEAFDNINDTVGAIAIDCHGNIAAGSSSGGIGMKHCGRTGPAALVGIGTSVIPTDPDDEEQTCTAAVASGTGEHIATTMAANTCAERIYSSTRRVNGEPGSFESVSEDEAMAAMIDRDFMGMVLLLAFIPSPPKSAADLRINANDDFWTKATPPSTGVIVMPL